MATPSPAQQQQRTTAFAAYISATYADRFDSYSGHRFEVVGQQSSGSSAIVKTHIIKASGEAVSMDYSMHQNDGTWLISDIYLEGAIRQLATQRSEFGAILRRDGLDGLIAMLQQKANLLTGNKAKAFNGARGHRVSALILVGGAKTRRSILSRNEAGEIVRSF